MIVADLNIEGAQKIAGEINDAYGEGRAMVVKMDVTKEEDVQSAFERAALAYGGIDIVVNNAGLATSSPFDETS
ncbi:SDR family NAD(P)-dependent oxidoreductase, partial [Pseudomonas sp. MOB-449]|nr:SDR family NAD(P)-dependent oxidoreductase [Pseudomonas sp. MOB-449]